jgi:hypothetical protein
MLSALRQVIYAHTPALKELFPDLAHDEAAAL